MINPLAPTWQASLAKHQTKLPEIIVMLMDATYKVDRPCKDTIAAIAKKNSEFMNM